MYRNITLMTILLIFAALPSVITAQEKKSEGATITISGTKLTLEQAIDLVLQNNLTLQSAKYDVVMSDSAYRMSQKKYDTTMNVDASYANTKIAATGLSALNGDKSYQYDLTVSASKTFKSGTTLSGGVSEIFSDTNDPALPTFGKMAGDPAYHTPYFFVSLQQELLKNAFGIMDRKSDTIMKNVAEIQRSAIIDQLSALVVSTLVDYWTITVRKFSVETARLELESDRQVRDIIARNVKYGLGELYDLNQYNALVASAESGHAAARQSYREAVRKLVRTMNMPAETRVEGVTNLVDELPVLDGDAAVRAGMDKRVDYKNAKLTLENTKMQLALYENASLPSLSVGVTANTGSQSEEFGGAIEDMATWKYPTWKVSAKVSYAFNDSENQTNLRNARLQLKQQEINIEKIRLEVRDDVLNSMERVFLQHTILMKARTATKESELYYQRALVRFRQGKINSATMRMALDTMVKARQGELEALVGYNVSLLQFDLSKNEIFERYNVDVEKYLASVKEK